MLDPEYWRQRELGAIDDSRREFPYSFVVPLHEAKEIPEWVKEHCHGRSRSLPAMLMGEHHFFFEDVKDAVYFKMRWK